MSTYGAQQTIVARSIDPDNVETYAVKDEEIVDTNGTEDAFAGGLPSALAAGMLSDEYIEIGYVFATICVTRVGPQYRWPKGRVF